MSSAAARARAPRGFERKALTLVRVDTKPNPLSLAHGRAIAENRERARQRKADALALDKMPRPLKPPPLPRHMPERVTAGQVALRRDKLLGVYEDARRMGAK